MSNLDSTLFPGISSSIEVHSGFKSAQAQSVHRFFTASMNIDSIKRTATKVLAAVESSMATHKTTKVTVVGHSLGLCY
jgi:triacylglycerol esterase/lipase EstA (alpha/beta hydrolase family)